jgi:hypothetical protein
MPRARGAALGVSNSGSCRARDRRRQLFHQLSAAPGAYSHSARVLSQPAPHGAVVDASGGSTSTPIPFTVGPPLTYHLATVLGYAPFPGDIVVTESSTPGDYSDLLRFTINGDLLVYSTPEPIELTPSLADGPLPTINPGGNTVFVQEQTLNGGKEGLFNYSVGGGSGMPGAPPVSVSAVTYNFTSQVPEPTKMTIVIAGGYFVAVCRRRRQ